MTGDRSTRAAGLRHLWFLGSAGKAAQPLFTTSGVVRGLDHASGSTAPRFELVPPPLPLIIKFILVASFILGAGGAAVMIVDGDPVVIVVIAAVAYLPVWYQRRRRTRVAALPDRLVVHNSKGEQLLDRSEITAFEIDTPSIADALKEGGIIGPTVYAVGRGGWRVRL